MSLFTDTFDRADSTNLGADWVELAGDVQILSNHVENITASAEIVAHWTADLASTDVYVVSNVVKLGGGTTGMGLILRKDGTADLTYYYFELVFSIADAPQNTAALYKRVAGGSYDQLATASVTLNYPGTQYLLRAEANGITLRLLVDGVEIISYPDNTSPIVTGQRAGMRAFSTSAGFSNYLDFEMGDLSQPTVPSSTDTLFVVIGSG